jgi:hypothetical protein
MKYPNIKNQKITICGLQGSGKTHYSKDLIKKHNYNVLVFSPHKHDFKNEPDNFLYYSPDKPLSQYSSKALIEEFDTFLNYAVKLSKDNLIDGVLIDEFDMLFRSNYDISGRFNDVIINHRHYNLFLIGITRRPQDIPAKYFEQCFYVISFAIQGDNNIRKFNNLQNGLGDKIKNLDYEKREFTIKQTGKPPLFLKS